MFTHIYFVCCKKNSLPHHFTFLFTPRAAIISEVGQTSQKLNLTASIRGNCHIFHRDLGPVCSCNEINEYLMHSRFPFKDRFGQPMLLLKELLALLTCREDIYYDGRE